MGFLSKLFSNEPNNKPNDKPNAIAVQNHGIAKRSVDGLFIHPDIADLLWVADGPRRNYVQDKKEEVYEYGGIRITFSGMQQDEPSLIYTKLPLAQVNDISKVERPPYYPTYEQLTPEQRSVYWLLLANPYNTDIDIGFVFILYYGLERHLLAGNYEKAFRVILKLRDVHKNGSFQSYSANALILTSLCRQRADLAFEFVQSLDKEYEMHFSDNLFILCKYGLNIPLTAKDIMRLAKSFEFANGNYIKNYPDIFEEILLANIRTKYNTDSLLVSKFITATENRKIRKQSVPIFANISIIDKNTDLPLLIENFKLKKAIYDLLEDTHEQAKTKISLLRKSGELSPAEKKTTKDTVVVVFDAKTEKELLGELVKNKNDILHKHFALIALQDFYYKYRESDAKYLGKCIDFCYEDLNLLNQLQKAYYVEQVKSIKQFASMYSKQETEKMLSERTIFVGDIPAFRRLAIIYEKQKEYEKALNICASAIQYYTYFKMPVSAADFAERKEKLSKKMK